MKQLRGTGVAMVTPFDKSGNVDFPALKKLTRFLISGNIDTLVVMGTTGESATLNKDEKSAVLNAIMEENNGERNIVLGIGGNNTAAVIESIKTTDFTGIDAILSVSPAYNKPTQEGIYQHYKAISEAYPIPIILYNVPGRTSSNIKAETTLRLANDCKNIVAVKEASGDLEQAMDIINNRPEGFLVLSGDDKLTLPMIAAGGDGVVSVVGNAFPAEFSAMVRAALANDFDTARKLHYSLLDITTLLFAEGNPGGIKAALKILGICGDNLRLPLVNVSEKTYQALERQINKIAKLVKS